MAKYCFSVFGRYRNITKGKYRLCHDVAKPFGTSSQGFCPIICVRLILIVGQFSRNQAAADKPIPWRLPPHGKKPKLDGLKITTICCMWSTIIHSFMVSSCADSVHTLFSKSFSRTFCPAVHRYTPQQFSKWSIPLCSPQVWFIVQIISDMLKFMTNLQNACESYVCRAAK